MTINIVTQLYASVSLNGRLLVQEKRVGPPPMEVMLDFMRHVKEAGNMIMGRKSAQALLGNEQAMQGFQGVELVVLSNEMQEGEAYAVARTPQAAISRILENGFKTALIAGGGITCNSFLSNGLVDELILNLSVEMTTNGIDFISADEVDLQFTMVESKMLNDSIIQLRLKSKK